MNKGGTMMPSQITNLAVRSHQADLLRSAQHPRAAAPGGDTPVTKLTLRYAVTADRDRLHALAELDSSLAPSGTALVAEIDGRLRAALPLDGGRPIADPFHRGAELIELLRMRAAQLVSRTEPAR
jgi:hypothetical protein